MYTVSRYMGKWTVFDPEGRELIRFEYEEHALDWAAAMTIGRESRLGTA